MTSPSINPGLLDERTLRTLLCQGEHAPLLSAYLGSQPYAELRELAIQASACKPVPIAPTVYVLPGLLGSRLGRTTASQTQLLWFDPAVVIQGQLSQLAIGKRRSIRALGVLLPGYLKLKLKLEIAGYKVTFHPYDWRRSIRDLGRQFAEVLHDDTAREIMIVAHSMGGLVARVALKQLAGAKITRVVQLGTPNHGSYGLVQALRACYPTVRKLGAVDLAHPAETLARDVFQSFHSLHEMLPTAASTPNLNLFRSDQWPQDALTPRTGRLSEARRLVRHLCDADRRCHTIIGVDQPTATGISKRDGEFVFELSSAGDGTVPKSLATWHGARHWYVAESHGQLPRNTTVCDAVVELLQNEGTSALESSHTTSTISLGEATESQLREALCGKVRWDTLSFADRRELLEPTVSDAFIAACQPF